MNLKSFQDSLQNQIWLLVELRIFIKQKDPLADKLVGFTFFRSLDLADIYCKIHQSLLQPLWRCPQRRTAQDRIH
jgi:hypothetical protein